MTPHPSDMAIWEALMDSAGESVSFELDLQYSSAYKWNRSGCCKTDPSDQLEGRCASWKYSLHLEEETVACLLLDGGLNTGRVGNGQVIADDLDARGSGEVGPCLPVVLVEGVFDRDLETGNGQFAMTAQKKLPNTQLGISQRVRGSSLTAACR